MDLRKKTDMFDEPNAGLDYEVRENDAASPLYKDETVGFDMDNDLADDQPSDIEQINMSIYNSLSAARTLSIIMSLFVGGTLCFAFAPLGLTVIVGGIWAALKLKNGAGWARSVCAVVSVINMLFGVITAVAFASSAAEAEFDAATGTVLLIFCLLFFIIPAIALYKMYVPKYVKRFFYRNKRR